VNSAAICFGDTWAVGSRLNDGTGLNQSIGRNKVRGKAFFVLIRKLKPYGAWHSCLYLSDKKDRK
jgi:hypothetical protein